MSSLLSNVNLQSIYPFIWEKLDPNFMNIIHSPLYTEELDMSHNVTTPVSMYSPYNVGEASIQIQPLISVAATRMSDDGSCPPALTTL